MPWHSGRSSTFVYERDSWAPDSGWRLKTSRSDADQIEAANLINPSNAIKIDEREEAKRRRAGLSHIREVSSEVQHSARAATLEVASRFPGGGWFGSEFVWSDEAAAEMEELGLPAHRELIGHVPPCTVYFIEHWPQPDELTDIVRYCTEVWEGRTPDQERDFPECRKGFSGPGKLPAKRAQATTRADGERAAQ